jgi:hypothetical protein
MGSYTLTTWFSDRRSETLLENLREICSFEVAMHNLERQEYQWQADECVYLEDAVWKTVEKIGGNIHSIPSLASKHTDK